MQQGGQAKDYRSWHTAVKDCRRLKSASMSLVIAGWW